MEIKLTNSLLTTQIDDEDFEKVSGRKWYRTDSGHVRSTSIPYVFMHHLIIGRKPGTEVDHKDLDGLNNRKSNLRFATRAQNQHNRNRQRNNRSGFKGVGFHKSTGLWRARISVCGKQLHLGVFATKQEAIDARYEAAKEFHGSFSR